MKRLKDDGQPARLLRWLTANPGASSLEITKALDIVNVTGRISDLRAAGYVVHCVRADGTDRYVIHVAQARPAPLSGEQQAMAL